MEQRVIVPLDVPSLGEARELLPMLGDHVAAFKVGKQLFTAEGPEALRRVQRSGANAFLDLKYHDIPNTVARAVTAAARHDVWMLTVHCSGGPEMLKAAASSARSLPDPPLVIGITVLTSLGFDDLVKTGEIPTEVAKRLEGRHEEGAQAYVRDLVLQRARLAKECGLNGVVASPKETALLRQELGPDFLIVNPGVRPAGSAADDQKRVGTVTQAIADGADFLVIGRPILQAVNPLAALVGINAEANAALAQRKGS